MAMMNGEVLLPELMNEGLQFHTPHFESLQNVRSSVVNNVFIFLFLIILICQ